MFLALVAVLVVSVAPVLPGSAFPPGAVRTNGEMRMTGAELKTRLSGSWTVVQVHDLELPGVAVPTLSFEEDRLTGFAGCNRFTSSLGYGDDGALKLGMVATTRMSCGPEAMKIEAQVLRAVGRVNGVTLDGEARIVLTAFGREMMVAERAE